MPARLPISVTIITLNEESHIQRAIESVQWAQEVIVVDSGSTDRTVDIARSLGAQVVYHKWSGYGQQKNFAQSQASHDWVLNIDADEEVSPECRDEILHHLQEITSQNATIRGFLLPRKTFYLGRWIRHGGWYPNYLLRLAHRKYARWSEPHVHEQLLVEGETLKLNTPLHHYAFSSIEEQIQTNLRFARLGSQDLIRKGKKPSLIKLILKPIGKFIETYWIKRGMLDGLPGLIISVNAAHSMFLKYAYLMESRIRRETHPHH
jgi:glycosyltransferase involved in cell wall biosynthesis